MLQYLVILLDNAAVNYCHYVNPSKDYQLISLDDLKSAIFYAMKENLMIQFVYPDYELPQEYIEIIETIDHSKIASSRCKDETLKSEADVLIFHDWTELDHYPLNGQQAYVLRTTKADLFERYALLDDVLSRIGRLNVVITDIESFTDNDFKAYHKFLTALSVKVEKLYIDGKSPQLNLLTDRLMLSQMNNCGAGDTNITLAPNAKFYVCPAFYYEDEADSVGDLEHGLDIKNAQLYKVDHAPICHHCDAWQCKRCVWLNRKTTLEVNTPSHEQCVTAHLERNASRELLQNIRKHGMFLPGNEIAEIDYLDPLDKRDDW